MRKSRLLNVLFVIALSLTLVIPVAANPSGAEPIEPQAPPPWESGDASGAGWAQDLWFVEFTEPPTARGGAPAEHANERAQLNAEARAEGIRFSERHDFTTLWNGLSIQADLADVTVLRGLPSVSAVYPVALIEQPEPGTVSPDLATALAMTGSDNAQDLGLTGAGVSVAIIDSGIDYNHPDLGGDGDLDNVLEAAPETRAFDHPRISHGWDYVGDDFDASEPDAVPDPNPDPMDPQGHGTHVAGIAGASAYDPEAGVTGVAPEVTFGAYKVFGTEGPTTADVIIDALEDSFIDGMDIVNMSLGATLAWGQDYPTTATSNELAAQGVVVVNSAGNDGALGTWSMSAPANGHDIISVASADNTFFDALVFDVEQLADPIPYMELEGAELPPTEGESAEVVYIGRACAPDPAFAGDPDELLDDPDGKIALIVRGDCQFSTKYTRAVEAGATGVIIHNNLAGMFAGTIGNEGVDGVWGAAINLADGLALRELIDDPDETVVLSFSDETATLPNPTGGLVSDFSSYGQDLELGFGPSIMAPGGLINSTVPGNGYATFSGTSMSAPHVAGAVALLLEAEPGLDPFEVRDRLQNTAEPAPWSLNPGLGLPDHTFRQGAGMLRIDRTVTAEQHVSPGQLALGDGNDPIEVTLTLTNTGNDAVTYTVDHTSALETAISTFAPDFFLYGASVDTPGEITVPAGSSLEVQATITPPPDVLVNHQYGGYIELTPTDEALNTLRVPYSGYAGDYQELPLFGHWVWPLDEEVPLFIEQEPRLSEIVYGEDGEIEDFQPVEPGHSYTVREGDFPVVEAFFGHSSQQMRMYAIHQQSGQEHHISTDQFLPRSPEPDFFWAFGWAGAVQAGASQNVRSVPSGAYILRVEALRTLGDPDNPDHWDVWESPEFQIDTRRGGPPAAP